LGVETGIRNKIVLLTGGSRGIGLAMAKGFAAEGAHVVITGRNEANLASAVEEIGADAHYVVGNAGDAGHPQEAVSHTIERFGSLDVLVNNAATNPFYGQIIDVDMARFRKTVDVNLIGPLRFAQEAWRQSMRENGGTILNIASIGGFGYSGPVPVYDLTKNGLMHLTRRLAAELGPNVRVNAIAPGLVKTDFAKALWEPRGDDDWPWALARLGAPTDVVGASLFLAGDASAWITGAVLVVDGGALLGGSLI
jgi:NAD(P)-dependent dehydrogenase (short-subunit alcohol dehydrogenase family)